MHALPINRVYLSATLGEASFGDDPDTLLYARTTDGRRSIVRQHLSTGLVEPLTTEPAPAGGVGYGGGLYDVKGHTLVYAARDGRLHALDLRNGHQRAITPSYEGVAAPAISPCGTFVAFLAEHGNVCNVLLVPISGEELPIKLSRDPWYAFNPAFSPDGSRVAWQEWDASSMPWDEARLVIARFAQPAHATHAPYSLLPLHTRTLSVPGVSLGTPRFSPDGQWLAYTSDEGGWRALWLSSPDGEHPRRLDTGPGEIGGPGWVPGLIPLAWSADSATLYAIRRHEMRDELVAVSITEGTFRVLALPYSELGGRLSSCGAVLAFTGAHAKSPQALLTLDTHTGAVTTRATSAVGLLDTEALASPLPLRWPTAGGAEAYGIFYPAVGASGPCPLLVSIHGGPTAEVGLGWHAQAQFFATRGWHYLFVNHRGGTGNGRAYQDLLREQWGILDIEDAKSGAEHLIARGLASPHQIAITGGSAGGYTTLRALTEQPDFWAAGVALYGIGDLYETMRGSHRFEAHYEQGLIGALPAHGPRWKERSPMYRADRVRAPVLLFHGSEDKAVPEGQSISFADAVRRAGGKAELVLYPDEGHGFAKEKNRRDCLEKTLRFLEKHVLHHQ